MYYLKLLKWLNIYKIHIVNSKPYSNLNLCLHNSSVQLLYYYFVSLGIAPTRNCTHFLKIVFVFTGGGFYSYYLLQGNKSDKERKIKRKKLSFMHTKRFNTFLNDRCNSVRVQFHVNLLFHIKKIIKWLKCIRYH